jgi:ubiquinone/menaquinone biosynthesis C-methylase UbiE
MKDIYHSRNIEEQFILASGVSVPKSYVKYLKTNARDSSLYSIELPLNFHGVGDYYNNQAYFSSEHGAYSEGYTYASRKEKYKNDISQLVKIIKQYNYKVHADYGSGMGYYPAAVREAASELGMEIESYAIDPSNIEAVEAKEIGVKRVKSSLQKISVEDSLFDIGTCHHTLEHLQVSDIQNALSEIARTLKNQAIFYAIIPTLDGKRMENSEVASMIINDNTHVTFGTRSFWREIFRNNGKFILREDLEKLFDAKNYGWVFCYEIRKD